MSPRPGPLNIAHKEFVEPLLARGGVMLSEYIFANLFLFRQVHQYELMLEPFPYISGITYDGVRHAMPLAPLDRCDLQQLPARVTCLYPLPQEMLAEVESPGGYVEWNDADSDYVYEARKLADLSGAALQSKRRQAELFESAARPSISTLESRHVPEANALLDLWAEQVAPLNRQTDYTACREALQHSSRLGLFGLCVTASGGRLCAFLLASRLGTDTSVVHFAKADRRLEGVYPYLFSRFATGAGSRWLNFEQDLAKPGLRQAKRALDPVRLVRKYRLSWGAKR